MDGLNDISLTANNPGGYGWRLINNHLYSTSGASIVEEFIQAATPQQYGAAGDGIADDTTAINACLTANSDVRFYGTYLTSAPLIAVSDQKIYCANCVINNLSTSTDVITATGLKNWAIQGRLFINGAGNAVGTAIGIHVSGGGESCEISGVTITGISGYGILVDPYNNAVNFSRGNNPLVSNCFIINNYYGVVHNGFISGQDGAEYWNYCNCNIVGNTFAMQIHSGNINVVGGNIAENTNGALIDIGTGNNGHGIFTGVQINHNVNYDLTCTGVTLGHTFNGCHFYVGTSGNSIIINSSGANHSLGIAFNGGTIDGGLSIDTGSTAYMSNVNIGPSYVVTGTGIVTYRGCFKLSGGLYTGNGELLAGTTVNGKALTSNIVLGLASADFVNQGTVTTVLIGNAAGNPSFGAVNLATMVTGILPAANLGTGSPGVTTVLFGDGTYKSAYALSNSQNASTDFTLSNTNAGASARATLQAICASGNAILYAYPSANTSVASWTLSAVLTATSGLTNGLVLNSGAGKIHFQPASGNVDVASMDSTGKMTFVTGANKSINTATLASGTVTVSNTAVTANSKIIIRYLTPSGTLGILVQGTIVAGTSFIINSLTTANALNTSDNSTVWYQIIN